MRVRRIAGALLLAVSAAPAAPAQDVRGRPAQPPVRADLGAAPRPAPEMAQLAVFDGSWTCEGTMSASPLGPVARMTSSVRTQRDLGGYWQSGVVRGRSAGQPPFEGRFHMTYDAAARRYVMLWFDSTGGWSQTTATGWDGDTMVFTGESVMGGKRMPTREVFKRLTGGALGHRSEAQMDGWKTLGDETCKKVAR